MHKEESFFLRAVYVSESCSTTGAGDFRRLLVSFSEALTAVFLWLGEGLKAWCWRESVVFPLARCGVENMASGQTTV